MASCIIFESFLIGCISLGCDFTFIMTNLASNAKTITTVNIVEVSTTHIITISIVDTAFSSRKYNVAT